MIEAVKLWNEPNNKSHWDFEIDPDWKLFAHMAMLAGDAVRAENATLTRVLGGMSPIDTALRPPHAANRACSTTSTPSPSTAFRSTGTTGRSTNGRQIWPRSKRVTDLPVWVTEVGVSTFGAEEVQEFGLRRTAELLLGRAPRVHWYSLYDLPRAWPATTRHREAEGSSYYRHFYMGLLREDGTPEARPQALRRLHARAGHLPVVPLRGPPPRRRRALAQTLGVKQLRTGLSWADSFRPGADAGSTAR